MPMLALRLDATFLGLPFSDFSGAFKDWQFISSVLVLNFDLLSTRFFGPLLSPWSWLLTQALAQWWQRMRALDTAGSTLMVP